MKQYLKHDAWCIVEEGFHPQYNEITESIFSLGNGRMGQRGMLEEHYSGKTLQGNYVAGVYYPDKTRVGWWKNGYPEYFAKVLNAANWLGLDWYIAGQRLDLHALKVLDFRRVLNMKTGVLERTCRLEFPDGKQIALHSKRINSMADDEAGAYSFEIEALNFSGDMEVHAFIDGNVSNKDANYGEKFWEEIQVDAQEDWAYVWLKTLKTGFEVFTGQRLAWYLNDQALSIPGQAFSKEKCAGHRFSLKINQGERVRLEKFALNLSSENHASQDFVRLGKAYLDRLHTKGFARMCEEQAEAWAEKWAINDIVIEGDVAAQQGIRFNIFQLNQTYTGQDERLNIGPKGFTGEKYGGSTYWDTEAYCVPFYLSTASPEVAKNLLIYRWKHLDRAKENARKLGFGHGAALYPMVTMNGEECHNEWEITFEEIHRNGAIAYAIKNYVAYTGDEQHLLDYGYDVLLGIARFWAQRVNWSEDKKAYVMLGVTGPNEYENNVNNNWYTNYLAAWCLRYFLEVKAFLAHRYGSAAEAKFTESQLTGEECKLFDSVQKGMYLPKDEERGIFLQQDGFLDKEIRSVEQIPADQRPINQHWSWDRILRSCYIKQADVLQGIYFFESDFSLEEMERNFNFYEPITVHESSLSPCVHSILAAKLGKEDKSYEFYTRAARLDLDDYNNDTEDGCHITSMAGTWMSIVQGFGGMQVLSGRLHFKPFLPKQWQAYSFKINFRENQLEICVAQQGVVIKNLQGPAIEIFIHHEAGIIQEHSERLFGVRR